MSSFQTLKTRLMRAFARRSFPFFEKYLGLHVTVNDYYSPIPSLKDLDPSVYDSEFSMHGVDLNVDAQFKTLRETFVRYKDEYIPQPNGGLSLADAAILYSFVRERKPVRMIEIGGGDSTLITLLALQRNKEEGHPCDFMCIEPYPRDFLKQAAEQGDFELRVDKVQDVAIDEFSRTDILFIDSSHVSKIGSDVNYEMFEILPRLKVGCFIHWHDIVIPTNYWKDWTENATQFWNESFMLHAFLQFNNAYLVVWASRYMKMKHSDDLKAVFPYLEDQHRLTSFWVERTGQEFDETDSIVRNDDLL